jgi:hypothetical protein
MDLRSCFFASLGKMDELYGRASRSWLGPSSPPVSGSSGPDLPGTRNIPDVDHRNRLKCTAYHDFITLLAEFRLGTCSAGCTKNQIVRPGCRDDMNLRRSCRSRDPMQSGLGIVGDGANKWPRCAIGHLLCSYDFGGSAPRSLTAASRLGNVAGVSFSSAGGSCALRWLCCTVSSSRIKAPLPPQNRTYMFKCTV